MQLLRDEKNAGTGASRAVGRSVFLPRSFLRLWLRCKPCLSSRGCQGRLKRELREVSRAVCPGAPSAIAFFIFLEAFKSKLLFCLLELSLRSYPQAGPQSLSCLWVPLGVCQL